MGVFGGRSAVRRDAGLDVKSEEGKWRYGM